MNHSLIQFHSFSLPKLPPSSSSSSTCEFSSNNNINRRRRRRFTSHADAVSASSAPLLDLPLLPFPKEQVRFRIRLGSVLLKPYPICSLFGYPSHASTSLASSTVKMEAESSSTKRPVCPECSKPVRVCLCTRFKTPRIENSVAVTILQHSLEKKHPLNSTIVASLGLANVNVVSVSDVIFGARFLVRLLGLDEKVDSRYLDKDSRDFRGFVNCKGKWNSLGGSTSCSGLEESCDFEKFLEHPKEKRKLFVHSDEKFCEREFSLGDSEVVPKCCTLQEQTATLLVSPPGAVSGFSEDDVVGFTVEKYGAISSITNHYIPKDQSQKRNKVDQLLSSILAANGPGKGFTVSKFQKKELNGNASHEEFEEFNIKVPPGSVLLFPSEKSVGIEAIDFKVTNIIVLDGTWAKARRMYNENPWLKHLPHLKLNLADVSLYREVRHQPKAGCLSTIESIVYTLKGLGEDSEKLDGLLKVFESMVGDQRRCKDERLSQLSVLVPLHLYEARYLALLEESMYKNNRLFVHFVLDPIAVNETFTEASFAARYACLVTIEKVERLDVGALVFIRGIGRVKLVEFGQEQPFLRGLVMPLKDYVLLDNSELDSKISELKEALRNLNSLEIKLKAPEEASLQTQTSNALKWAEKPVAIDCEEVFIPSLAERISFSALQPVSGSSHSELTNLQKEKIRAMDIKDTAERIGNSMH